MSGWPFPGDAPLARARRVAHAYRSVLLTVAPDRCADLDAQMREWGQGWALPRVLVYDLDDWLTAVDAADVAAVDPAMLRIWRKRGLLTGRRLSERRWQYRAGDVLALAATARRRGRSTMQRAEPKGSQE